MGLGLYETLSAVETDQLLHCEDVIKAGIASFIDVGNALQTINQQRLYRAKYDTFESYCRDRWNLSKAYAYAHIQAANVVGNLSEFPVLPANEAQVEPLTSLKTAEEQRAAWAEVIELSHGERITAAIINRVVRRRCGKNAKSESFQTIVVLNEPLFTRLVYISETEGVSQSEVVRRALSQYFGGQE